MADTNELNLSSSPHFHSGLTTQKIMFCVVLAMLPLCIAGTITFGIRSLFVILVSVAACLLCEYLFDVITKRSTKTIQDGSAVITGILLALTLPPTVPFWQLILGDFVAIVIVKNFFGGLGQNVWNPALGGRAFLFISFPSAIGASWIDPATDAVTSATVLSQVKSGSVACDSFFMGNGHFAGLFQYKDLYRDFLTGQRGGCIGETCGLLIILAGLFLILVRVIDWRTPLAFIGTVTLCNLIAGNDIVLGILGGGLLLGAFFMATDYVTTPVTKPGRLLFGLGCGIITFLIRQFGGYPEGVMFSILFMNCLTPFLTKLTSRKYGYARKAAKK